MTKKENELNAIRSDLLRLSAITIGVEDKINKFLERDDRDKSLQQIAVNLSTYFANKKDSGFDEFETLI